MRTYRDSFHDEIYTDPHTGTQYRVDYYADYDNRAPDKEGDCHGVIEQLGFNVEDNDEMIEEMVESGLISEDYAMRLPLFRLLHSERSDYLYYDFVASLNRAVTEWGCSPEDAKAAVEHDYEYLRGWYQDEWHWMSITVTKLDEDGEETDDYHSIGGYESLLLDERGDLDCVLGEMVYELESQIRETIHKDQLVLPLAA